MQLCLISLYFSFSLYSMLLLCLLVPLYFIFSYFQCCFLLFPNLFSLISNAAALCCFQLLFFLLVFPSALPHFPLIVFLFIFKADVLSSCSPFPTFFLLSLLMPCLLDPLYSSFSLYYMLHCLVSIYSSLFIFHGTALSSGSPLLFFILLSPAFLSSCFLCSSLSYYPCCCSVFLFPFSLLFFLWLSLLLLCLLVHFSLLFFLWLFLLLLCLLVPFVLLYLITPVAALSTCSLFLYSSFSDYSCCCTVFLFPFSLLFFLLLPLLLLCLLLPFVLLYRITAAAALSSCSLYSSFSEHPCCCSVFLFPLCFFIWLSWLLLCLIVPFLFTLLSLIIPVAALSSCSLFLYSSFSSIPAAALSCSLCYSLSYYPCCCSVFLFPLFFFILLPLLLLCLLVPFYSTFSLCSLLLCLVSFYYSWSYDPCCCSVFLFPFTLLDLFTPVAALFSCSLYSSWSNYPCCCCSVFLFPFTLLNLIIPAAALSSCSHCFS